MPRHVNNPFSYLRCGLIFTLTNVDSRCDNEGAVNCELRHSCMVWQMVEIVAEVYSKFGIWERKTKKARMRRAKKGRRVT